MRRKKHNLLLPVIVFSILFTKGYSQHVLASFQLTIPTTIGNTMAPQSIDLDKLTKAPDSVITLVEIKDGIKHTIAAQIEKNTQRILHWMVYTGTQKSIHTYQIIQQFSVPEEKVTLQKINGSMLISSGQHPLLNYHYATSYPPPGVDTVFKRSGFIHPLYAPHGQILTRINAPDHYHHYGLWNPWTKVLFKGKTIDFWNLRSKQGTVRFARLLYENQGPVYSEYQVLHDHVIFEKDGSETIPLTELQTVRVYAPDEKADAYIMDITIQLNCATDSPVVLKEYRYGGLGWRATEQWNDTNSETLTSEGKTRKDADGTTARWVIVQGAVDNDYAGIVMMSHPDNYNYPEPLRIWPEKMNGRGDVYANFSPTKNKDWHLEPGMNHVLRYRLLVYNGHMTKERAEAAWQQYGGMHISEFSHIHSNQ